jgi:hypothetical protein
LLNPGAVVAAEAVPELGRDRSLEASLVGLFEAALPEAVSAGDS